MSLLRPPTEDDAHAAARLMSEHKPEPIDPSDVLSDWTSPRVDLTRDARIGDDAYVLVEDIGEGRVWIEVHGEGASDAVEWAESRAAEIGNRILTGGWSTNEELFAELERRGYRHVRSSRRMQISLEAMPPEPAWPDGIEARTLRDGEERAVYDVHQEAFEDTWEPMRRSFEDWAHWNLQPPRFAPDLWFLALDGADVCGVAMCHPHATLPATGWVGVLAVRREWRGRGIGRALLLRAFRAFRQRGLTRAALGVDSVPGGAMSLYEDVGMVALDRFDIYERTVA